MLSKRCLIQNSNFANQRISVKYSVRRLALQASNKKVSSVENKAVYSIDSISVDQYLKKPSQYSHFFVDTILTPKYFIGNTQNKKSPTNFYLYGFPLVGVTEFEPVTPCRQNRD